MTKIPILALFIALISHAGIAQTPELILKSGDKGLYLDHKVTPKENFYSIGRMYNVSAKEISAFNKLDMSKGLNIGQIIRIPLTTTNFSQSVNEGAPVYYKVNEKEGLSKVSSAANNVSPDNLRRWNNLKEDNINAGGKLIVGFLVSSQQPSITIAEKKEPVIADPVRDQKKETKIEPQPVAINKESKVDTLVKTTTPVQEIPKIEINPALSGDEGYFKSMFEQQVKTIPLSKVETVTSGIFKTASGWQDGKYYLLMDGVQAGTIIRVINPGNNKTVYAKVLGEMNGIRQNEGLNIRISNSAASVLQVTEPDKFVLKVSY